MKSIVISYSLTGNNKALATSIAKALAAEHITIAEPGPRTMVTIVLDLLFNRTPGVAVIPVKLVDYELVIFAAPVWMGHVATPLCAYFKFLKKQPVRYAFISISGGADGANTKLGPELVKRTGAAPAALIDLHIADLLAGSKAVRKETSAYRLTDNDIKKLTATVLMTLKESMAKN